MARFLNGVHQLGSVGDSADQVSVCAAAFDAWQRGNPAAGELIRRCQAIRSQNVAAGRGITDAMSVDPTLQAQLADVGARAVSASPALSAALTRLPSGQQRGFQIGTAVRLMAKDAGYVAHVRKSWADSNPEKAGYLAGVAGGGDTQNSAAPSSGGISTPVIVGGIAISALAIAAAVYKLTR